MQKEMYLLHYKFPEFQNKLKKSHEIIAKMLNKVKKPYVAFSGGKDSTVLAHLVLQHKPDIELQFLESGESTIIHDFDRLFADFEKITGAKVTRIKIDRVFEEKWIDVDWETSRKAGKRDIQTMLGRDNDCVFMGLRKEESYNRKQTLIKHGVIYKYKGRNFWRCCPLADWNTIDIGAYIVYHGLPILEDYKKFGFNFRTTARLTGDAVRCNALTYLKKKDINAYNIILKRFPELKDML